MRSLLFLSACMLTAIAVSAGEPPADFAIHDGDTVVFLGDSITAEGTYPRIIENYTLLRFPDRKVRFINAGIGGDTAQDGLARLERDVLRHNPTLVTVAFGINDIGWGMTADDQHRQQHLDAIRSIVEACVSRDIRVFVCSAAITGNNPAQGEDSFLQKMSDAAMQISRDLGGDSIDVQRMMRQVQQKAWDVHTDLSTEKRRRLLHTADTIHLNELGKLAMAHAVLKGLHAPADVSSATLDAASHQILNSTGCQISDVERTATGLAFTRLDNGLPLNLELFYEQNYKYVPVPDTLNRHLLSVRHLPVGRWKLTAEGRDLGTFTNEELQDGINIASATGNAWAAGGPWVIQAWNLNQLTQARHRVLQSLQQTTVNLPNSTAAAALTKQTPEINERLITLQRAMAQPARCRFELTPVPNEAATTADGITIESPLNYQVIQRDSGNRGHVRIRGRFTTTSNRVQIRVRHPNAKQDPVVPWQEIPVRSGTSDFDETIALPAGGWYALDVRTQNNDATTGEVTVSRFGVGEVFVGAGQSNATNAGQHRTEQTSGMVAAFSGTHWQLANDPQPGVSDNSQGGSFWPAFGDAMFRKYGVPIGVAATGFGGTSVEAWHPDQGLYLKTLTRMQQLGPQGFRALLWHQGESDVAMNSDTYFLKLRRIIESSRRDAGWQVPWFVAQTSYLSPDAPRHATTRQAQQRLWQEKIAHPGPDTDTLTGDHRDHDGQGIHLSPKGLKMHGNMWARLVGTWLESQLTR